MMAVSKGKEKKKFNWRHAIPYYIMVLPGLAYLIINDYVPMFGIVIAFKRMNFAKGIMGSDWVGFDKYLSFYLPQRTPGPPPEIPYSIM